MSRDTPPSSTQPHSAAESQIVVYVDPDPDRRATSSAYLEQALDSIDVIATGTGDLSEHRFDADCIVSRYELPETDGISLLEELREQCCHLPYLLVTDSGSEELASEAIAAGVTDYVPIEDIEAASERLAARIDAALERTSRCVDTDRLDGIDAAVENAADAIVITDLDGTITYVNPAFETVTGFSREEAIGRNPRILKSGVQDDAYYEEKWGAILDGEIWEEEIVNETKSGEEYVAHQTVAPVTDSDGTITKFVGIQRDVTKQRRLEKQIERSRATLETLYEIAADEQLSLEEKIGSVLEAGTEQLGFQIGYFTRIDDDTQTILAAVGEYEPIQAGDVDPLGETYCRKTAQNDEPVLISDALEAGWDEDPAFERFGLRCYLGARVVVDGEVFGTLCFGGEEPAEKLVLEARESTVKALARWLGYEIDRHRYESKLERHNDRLEKFASVVSHDLRNPLNVASARVELARDTGDDEHFEQVVDAHERMESIIEDTLTLAREGKSVTETRQVSLERVVTDCWNAVETPNATLRTVDELTIDADVTRVRHIFENLFRNASEHVDGDVTVEVGSMSGGFYVADNGPGIPEAKREQVFDHGYADNGGTGFGLAIVKSIADAHGWEIHLTESADGGARFEFLLAGAGDQDEESVLLDY